MVKQDVAHTTVLFLVRLPVFMHQQLRGVGILKEITLIFVCWVVQRRSRQNILQSTTESQLVVMTDVAEKVCSKLDEVCFFTLK